ncbi:MAG TPA: gliding motility-associated C-terminal domain-containing protein, partial [Flavipsychrobacter sp.]|nr:gliding motility-associated C-terminal domain-containing protein [Flavipsychrobacter sp.]
DGVAYRQYKNVNGNFTDGSLPVGSYVAVATNPALSCNATVTDTLQIADSGTYPYPPTTATIVNYCINQTPVQLSATTMPGAILQWYNDDSKLSAAPTPPTTVIDTATWFVDALYKTCQSAKDTITVYVHNNPVASILNKKESVCLGDKIYLEATGGELYNWAPRQDVSTDEQGRPYTQIMEPTTYIVTATNQFGCTDTASISYTDIMQCCQFSYPTVFSPNNDGRNDHFNVITYGNMVKYDLKIFNRWGQLVFYSDNPTIEWDGTFQEKPCELGTYFYLFNGQCITGRTESRKGEITLIR